MRCKVGKECESKCGDNEYFSIWRIKRPTSVSTSKLCRLRRSVGDITSWISNLGHVVMVMKYLLSRKATKQLPALYAGRALKDAYLHTLHLD